MTYLLLLVINKSRTELPFRFDVVTTELVVEGYQLYAVEKWVVDRDRPIVTLTVYTGDPTHKITVSALAPSASLSSQDAEAEWDRALLLLRRDGARPRDTPLGVLMTTSLANFRSDYTIIHIPTGDFRDAQHQLYANINLLRMGCSGRTALSLDEPSETTKRRFLSMYHIPDPAPTSLAAASTLTTSLKPKTHKKSKSLDPSKLRQTPIETHRFFPEHPLVSPPTSTMPDTQRTASNALFSTAVIELVRIVQAALSVFGFFPPPPGATPRSNPSIDGLLCDNTVVGIQSWIAEIGGPFIGIEPMERVMDPTVVSALLSLVLVTRNKLAFIGYAHVVPKDPFLNHFAMSSALAAYIVSSPQGTRSSLRVLHARSVLPLSHTSSSAAAAATPRNMGAHALDVPIIQSINRAYERARPAEARRVHRVLLGKFDELRVVGGNSDGDVGELDPGLGTVGGGIGSLASGLGLGLSGGGSMGGAGGISDVVMDLGVFAHLVAAQGARERKGRGKGRDGETDWVERKRDGSVRDSEKDEVGASLRALWGRKIETLVRIRERAEMTSAAQGKDSRDMDGTFSDGDADEIGRYRDKLTEEESELLFPNTRLWPGRVQKKLEAWTGLNRKKQNVDLGIGSPSKGSTASNEAQLSPTLPVAIPKERDPADEEELLSSGQASPISELKTHALSVLSEGSAGPSLAMSPGSSALNLTADYERRLSALNQKRPWSKLVYPSRVSSWADPLSAQDIVEEGEHDNVDTFDLGSRSNLPLRTTSPSPLDVTTEISDLERERQDISPGDPSTHNLKRRHSFHSLDSFHEVEVLRMGQMRIDVELCGQLLIMYRRAPHLRNVLSCLQLLTMNLSKSNALLREDYQTHLSLLAEIESQTKVMAEVDTQRLHADVTTQETNTLLYESALFDLGALWDTASPPRQKVLALREKVFGTGGRRLPRGTHGSHGQFNRLQWTLDERERLVDWLGRTESEAEDEDAVKVARVSAPLGEDDEEDVVEHPAMKPVWLLRFFETWGVRWGSTKQQEDDKSRTGISTASTSVALSDDNGTNSRQAQSGAALDLMTPSDMTTPR